MTDSDVKTIANTISMLPGLPDQFEFSIRSWHDGAQRQYVCTVVDTRRHQEWTTAPYGDIRSAYVAAMAAAGIPVVNERFWFGLRAAVPLTLLLWLTIAVVILGVGRWLWWQ